MDKKQVVFVDIDKIQPYEGNAKSHPEKQIKVLMGSLKEFGFVNPILVDEDFVVLAGHGRLVAAERLGLEHVPVLVVEGLSEEQKRAYRIADNRIAELAKWDDDALFEELKYLAEQGFDLEITGVDYASFAAEFDKEGNIDDDELPDDVDVFVKRGDVWQLGRHRIACGDSLDLGVWEKLFDGKSAHMIFTDPPYNIAYEGKRKKRKAIANDNLSSDEFYEFLSTAFSNINAFLVAGAPIYVCYASPETLTFVSSFLSSGFYLSNILIWVKDNFVFGRLDYHFQYEPILYGWKSGGSHFWYGGRKKGNVFDSGIFVEEKLDDGFLLNFSANGESITIKVPEYEIISDGLISNIWRFHRPKKSDIHPTMKPVALVSEAIRNSSRVGQIVCDPFLGSGSTLIAAEKTNRICYGIEYDEQYCSLLIKRWEEFTGEKACRVG